MAFPKLIRWSAKTVLEILPSVAATVIGGYLLAQIHFARSPETPQQTTTAAVTQSAPTAREDRAVMREVLKERRERPETPAEVRPVVQQTASATVTTTAPQTASTQTGATTAPATGVAMDSIAANETVTPARTKVVAVTAAPVTAGHNDTTQIATQQAEETYVPAPPFGLPPAQQNGINGPTRIIPPAVEEANEQAAQQAPQTATVEQPQRGPVGAVFSSISNVVGHAANATGNTLNWVIDLPGRAISAGGRAIGVSPPPPTNRPFS